MEERDSSTTSSQASEQGQKFDVFLSHSGKQKSFVRQLHRDLTNQGVSCFFDQDRDCLPLAQPFPPRIFEAINTCQVAVLLLSIDFLGSKWPMLELSHCVEVKYKKLTNRNLKILPLFFLISPDDLKNIEEIDKEWQKLKMSSEKRKEWKEALKAIRPNNGLTFGEGGDELKFRDEIVKEIWDILPTPSPRYHVRGMQGEARMCKEVANFFNKVQPRKGGVLIVGLYGIAGHGKTTLGKAFCNFKLGEFEGRVCYLEFGRGDSFERAKHALRYLTHCPYQLYVTDEDQAKVELSKRVSGKRVLLVLDNITQESKDEVRFYLETDFGGNSWFLLSARSAKVLERLCQIDRQSCMHVPRLEEEEAVTILLERASRVESILKKEDRHLALACAKTCQFKENRCDYGPRFHPLALKAFGSYLLDKHGFDLPTWVREIDGLKNPPGDALDEVFAVIGKAFDAMHPKYRTIFMLLTVYILPNMSSHKVIDWMEITCNITISFIEKALQSLRDKAFIEEFEPEIRIHDLYMEFAQSKADKMERWLWRKQDHKGDRRALISEDEGGFELAKLEHCMYETIQPNSSRNLLVLQLVNVQNMNCVDFARMENLRSITLRDCKSLEAVKGMEKLHDLAWLQIKRVNPMFELPKISLFKMLKHIEIHIPKSSGDSRVTHRLGDLTSCSSLREISVGCPSLIEFPGLKGMEYLEKVEFSLCDKVEGPLDCTGCVELQTIVLSFCSQMAASPLLVGCKKLSKLVLSECGALTTCPDVDVPTSLKTLELQTSSNAALAPRNLELYSELENLQLWNMGELKKLPSFERFSNLPVLKLGKCGIREPPDLKGCKSLQNVYFFSLIYLKSFPNFSLLKELKRLSLCNCISVHYPPEIGGCLKLELFHLLYNDNMKGLPKIDKCAQLQEIQVSWRSVEEVSYEGFDPDSCQLNEELEFCLEYWKDETFGKMGNVKMPEELKELQCVQGERIQLKRYFRGVRLYYSLTSPYQWFKRSVGNRNPECQTAPVTLRWMKSKVIVSGKAGEDGDWLNKVRGYFASREDIVHVGAASDIMQGEGRMCQMLSNLFDKVPPNEKGVRTAGLFGMAGLGKTTLAKHFCIHFLKCFNARVVYVDISTEERERYLSQSAMLDGYLELVTNKQNVNRIFDGLVKGQRVLLVIDDISDENIDQVKYCLDQTELGEKSFVLLSTRSPDLLENHFNLDLEFCMHVPSLEIEEAVAILLQRAVAVESELPAESSWVHTFSLISSSIIFHPLALKVLGRHSCRVYGGDFFRKCKCHGQLFLALPDVFAVLDKVLESMEYENRTIFIFLVRQIPPHMATETTFERLSTAFKVEIAQIENRVQCLHESAFIEEIQPKIRIHELLREFALRDDVNSYDTQFALRDDVNSYDTQFALRDDVNSYDTQFALRGTQTFLFDGPGNGVLPYFINNTTFTNKYSIYQPTL